MPHKNTSVSTLLFFLILHSNVYLEFRRYCDVNSKVLLGLSLFVTIVMHHDDGKARSISATLAFKSETCFASTSPKNEISTVRGDERSPRIDGRKP